MLSGISMIDPMNFIKSSVRYRVFPWASRPVVLRMASPAIVEAIRAESRWWKPSKKVSTTFLTVVAGSPGPTDPCACVVKTTMRQKNVVAVNFAMLFGDYIGQQFNEIYLLLTAKPSDHVRSQKGVQKNHGKVPCGNEAERGKDKHAHGL